MKSSPAAPTFRPLLEADLQSWNCLQRDHMPDGYNLDTLRDELHARHARVLGLVEDDGEVQAAILSWLILDELQIMQVVVHPRRRGEGLGRALVLTALRQARAEGAVQATLEVRSTNVAAIALYKSLDFKVNGRRPRYYRDGEDALLMRLDMRQR